MDTVYEALPWANSTGAGRGQEGHPQGRSLQTSAGDWSEDENSLSVVFWKALGMRPFNP